MVLKLTPPLVNPKPWRCLAFGFFFEWEKCFLFFFKWGKKNGLFLLMGKTLQVLLSLLVSRVKF